MKHNPKERFTDKVAVSDRKEDIDQYIPNIAESILDIYISDNWISCNICRVVGFREKHLFGKYIKIYENYKKHV